MASDDDIYRHLQHFNQLIISLGYCHSTPMLYKDLAGNIKSYYEPSALLKIHLADTHQLQYWKQYYLDDD